MGAMGQYPNLEEYMHICGDNVNILAIISLNYLPVFILLCLSEILLLWSHVQLPLSVSCQIASKP